MPTYLYKARDSSGKIVRGSMEAAVREDLVSKLHKMGYMATQIREETPGFDLDAWVQKMNPVRSEDLLMFYIQLSNMVSAGMTLLSSLQTLHEQTQNRKLKEVLGDLSRNIESGDHFSDSLSRHPKIFPSIFVSMARVGEVTGKLDSILLRYAAFSESQEDLKQKIQNAFLYPMILLTAGVGAILFIITFVIPQFSEIFLKAGVRLPLLTRLLYHAGLNLKHHWVLLVLGFLSVWAAVTLYFRTKPGSFFRDRWKLKIPVAGELYRKASVARFARTLGILTGSGVPILQSLDIAREVVDNELLSQVVRDARLAVERGERIAGPLKVSGQFPADVVQMISVGEETGNLDGMLGKIADFYDMSIGYSVKKLTTLLENLFLLVMGALIGLIMASLLLPIFDMVKILRR